MRRISSLASRVSTATTSFRQEIHNQSQLKIQNPAKLKSLAYIDQNPSRKNANFPPSGEPPFKYQCNKSPRHSSISNNPIPVQKRRVQVNPVDHKYISHILSSKDWYLLLNHELKAKRLNLNDQQIVSILQNQENPLCCLRLYAWVFIINPSFTKNQSIRSMLANALYRKGPVLLSADLIQDITCSGFCITEDFLCILISSWGRLGLARYCAEIFEQISFLGLNPSTRLYNAVMDALVKSNSLDIAYLKFQQMPVDNCTPDRFTYNILIHGVCRVGVVDEALRLVKQMEGKSCFPNVFTYTILIDGFCNAKRVDEAFNIMEKLKEKNLSPNDATFRSLVFGVFRSMPPEKAFEMLSNYVEREPLLPKVACDTILHCLSENFLSKEVASFLKKIIGKGYLPDTSTFNITTTCLIKGLDLEETCQILDGLEKRGVKPGFNVCLMLVEALYKKGKLLEGNRYLNQMFIDGLVLNVFSYNMVIDCLSKAKMVEQASQTFEEMCGRGIVPNLVTFNTLIAGHCRAGQLNKAKGLLRMLLENGFKPDIVTFSSIIDGLCRLSHVEDAFDCFMEMAEWGVTPNAVMYNILIRSLSVSGDIVKSMKLLRNMQSDGIKPDVYSFNAIIQSFCRMNKIEKAKRLLVTMLVLDLSPDNYTYCAFIKALCHLGKYAEAKQLFLSMESNGCTPDSYTCNLFIEALVQASQFEEAQTIFEEYKKKGIALKTIPIP